MLTRRLRFLYRYLFASQRWHRWLNAQSMLVLVISAAFLATLYMTAPFSGREEIDPGARPSTNRQALAGVAMAFQATDQTADYPYPAPSTGQEVASSEDQGAVPVSTLPAEYYQNTDQTVGLTLAATVLVMIVVFGALMYIPRYDEE